MYVRIMYIRSGRNVKRKMQRKKGREKEKNKEEGGERERERDNVRVRSSSQKYQTSRITAIFSRTVNDISHSQLVRNETRVAGTFQLVI